MLEAARAEFAAHGYEKASMRGIARAADVNAALLHHYFGSKDQLFLAALDFPVDPQVVAPLILAGDRAEVGERLARFVVSLWAQPEVRDRLLAVLRTVTSSEEVAALVRGFVVRELVGRVAEGLRLPDAELRVEFALAQILGLALARYVVRVEPVASAGADELVALLAPTLQLYLGEEA